MSARPVALVALGLYAVACLALWPRETWAPDWDSAIYLLTARSLAEGAGYVYLDQPFFLRPPGMAWLLSFFFADGGFDPVAVHRFIGLCAVLAAALVYAVARRRVGSWTALGVAALCATHPLWMTGLHRVLSEFPFLLSLLASVWLLERSAEAGRRWWAWSLAGAVCLAAAAWVRTAALILLPACVLLARREGRTRLARAVLPAVVCLVLVLPWLIVSRQDAAAAEVPSEQLLLHDYTTALLRTDPGDPGSPVIGAGAWADRLAANGTRLVERLGFATAGLPGLGAGLLVVALAAAGWVLCVRRDPGLLEAWALLYCVVVLVYFTFARRLVAPLVPAVILYLLVAVMRLGRARRGWGPAGRGLAVVVCLALGGSNAVALLERAQGEAVGERRPGRTRLREARTYRLAEWITENTAPDAVLLANEAPSLALLTGRRVYTYRFPRRPLGELIDRHDVDYVVFDFEDEPPRGLRAVVASRTHGHWELPSDVEGRRLLIHRVGDG